MKYADVPIPVREYLLYMETVKGRSPKTVSEYHVDLRSFFRFFLIYEDAVPFDTPFSEIDASVVTLDQIRSVTLKGHIYGYMKFLMDDRGNKSDARARKASSLRGFFTYLKDENMISDNPAEKLSLPSREKKLPKHLSVEQCRQLLSAINGTFRVRDYCIITLFLNCGMRVSELVSINRADIQQDTIRITGKGNKQRMVYLNAACIDALAAYQNDLAVNPEKYHRKPNEKALFLNKNGGRISTRGVELMLEKYLKASGLSGLGFSPHKLRHTAATLLYQEGDVDIHILQKILGHENLATTEIYTHVSNKQVAGAVEKNPLAHETMKKE